MSDLRLLNNRRFTEDDANALSTEGKVYPINEILKRGYFVSLNNQLQLNTTRRYRVFLDNQTSLPEYEKTITQIFKANQK